MSLFEPVTLTWKGADYTVEADRVMMLIAKIEDVITLGEVASGKPPFAKIAFAYAEALNYAGATVNSEEVYISLFGDKGMGMTTAVANLLSMMMPPEALRQAEPEKKPKKSRSKKA